MQFLNTLSCSWDIHLSKDVNYSDVIHSLNKEYLQKKPAEFLHEYIKTT